MACQLLAVLVDPEVQHTTRYASRASATLTQLSFIEPDGSLRPGHEVFHEF